MFAPAVWFSIRMRLECPRRPVWGGGVCGLDGAVCCSGGVSSLVSSVLVRSVLVGSVLVGCVGVVGCVGGVGGAGGVAVAGGVSVSESERVTFGGGVSLFVLIVVFVASGEGWFEFTSLVTDFPLA